MDRDWPEPKDQYSRLDTDLSEKDPADADEIELNDIERRDTLTAIVDSVKPEPKAAVESEAGYADTDLNPNPEDIKDEREADPDEIG